MDYTQSDGFATHSPTGQRMHQESGTVPTAVSQKDLNSITWSLMEIVKAGGRSGVQFDPDTPASYQQLLIALQSMITTASGDIPGRVSVFMQPTAPLGWLPMTGLLLSRTTYPALWAHVQTVGAVSEADWTGGRWGWFSAGDGSTTFRIPDLRAMTLRGLDDGRGIDLARVLGSYQAAQMLAHSHGINDPQHGHVVVDPRHNHVVNDPGHAHAYTSNPVGQSGGAEGGSRDSVGSASASTGNTTTGISLNAVSTGISLNAAGTGITVNTSSGGAEVRVANIALPFYVKY